MALWLIEKSEAGMALRYSTSAVPDRFEWQMCGACQQVLADELLAWVAQEAALADQIQTAEGVFVKVLGPGGAPARA